MKSVIIIMSLLGCTDDGGQCQLIDTVAGNWPTVEACQAAQREHLTAVNADQWPVLMASCNEKSTVPQTVASLTPPPAESTAATGDVTQSPLPPPAAAETPAPEPSPETDNVAKDETAAGEKSAIPGVETVKSAVTWVRDGSVLVMRHTGDLVKKTGRMGLDLITGGNGS